MEHLISEPKQTWTKYLEQLKLNVYKKIGIFEISNMEQKGMVQKMFWNIKTQISIYFGL